MPQQGVSRDVKGNPIALVVKSDDTIETRQLVVDRAIKNYWLVASGIDAGDRVVVEGTSKVRTGSAVTTVELKFDSQTGAMVSQNAATTSASN